MKTPLIALFSVLLTLPLGCKIGNDAPPDPLAKPEGFCDEWAKAACQQPVVDACNANSVDDCVTSQTASCLTAIPADYVSTNAQQCLDAVKGAYSDAKLTPEEVTIVIQLGAPCDQLSSGSRTQGQSCTSHDECNTADGFTCIMKQGATKGTCAKPEVVDAGGDCSGDTQVCADGYFCNGDNCVVDKKTGGACDGDYECKPEDHCVASTDGTTSACAARLALNKDCTTNADCASNYCAIAPNDSAGQCASTIVLSRNEPLCLNLR